MVSLIVRSCDDWLLCFASSIEVFLLDRLLLMIFRRTEISRSEGKRNDSYSLRLTAA